MKEKILLDTDIGNDIDDSVCLAYLLRHERCELLGITTVSGEPAIRAMLASAICRAAGRDDIPIYPGAANPLLTLQKQPVPHQKRHLHKWTHATEFPKGEAVEFMRRTIRANPGEVTLLCIGQMTNAALLFAVDDEIPSLLKGLVLMCGAFTYRYKGAPCLNEWNARCDPYATAIVYNAPVKNIVSVGLDVTTEVVMEKDEIIEKFNGGILKTVYDFSGIEENTRQSITFHDPLAAAVIFDKSICGFRRGNVDIELGSERVEGLTCFTETEDGKNEVAFSVDRDRFCGHYFSVVKGGA